MPPRLERESRGVASPPPGSREPLAAVDDDGNDDDDDGNGKDEARAPSW
jgi:hypothetical protein